MRPEVAAWLANLRTELTTGALYVAICSTRGPVAIFPDDIVGKTDDELLAFLAGRLQSSTHTPDA